MNFSQLVGVDPLFFRKAAVGLLHRSSPVCINGRAALSTSFIDVWPQAIVKTLPSTPVKFGFSSSNANDAAAGTGLRTFSVQFLDVNYDIKAETITLNGQTKVETTGSYIRFLGGQALTFGSGGALAGELYGYDTSDTVTSGVPQTATKIFARLNAGETLFVQAMYTVPRGFSLIIPSVQLSAYNATAASARFRLRWRDNASAPWKMRGLVTVGALNSPYAVIPFETPLVFDEFSDIGIQAIGSASINTATVVANAVLAPKG